MRSRLRLLTALGVAVPAIAAFVSPTIAGAAPAAPRQTQVSADPAATIAHASRLGAVPADRQMSVAVALRPRHLSALHRFVSQVSDPSSSRYHHFLTSKQYNERYAPTTATVARVSKYLAGKGLRVRHVSGNRQVVDVTGTSDDVTAAFGTTIGRYTDRSGRHFYANDRAATMPADVGAAVRSVTGLSNRFAPYHADIRAASTPANNGTGPNGGFAPGDLQKVYGMTDLAGAADGAGETVGLIEFDAFHQSDIDGYTQHFGLSSVTPSVRDVDGGTSVGSGQAEVVLDIEGVIAIAPAADQVVYEAPNTNNAWVDEMNAIASDNRVNVVSASWLLGEACSSDPISASHDAYTQMVAQGISVLSASGDWGGHGCDYNGDNSTVTVDYPASDPVVLGVGGTAVTNDSSQNYQSEKVWNSGSTGSTRSGGGYSTIFDKPDYQTTNDRSGRLVPDVAINADPNNGGLSIYLQGGWSVYGGTSLSSPEWAAFLSLVNQESVAGGGSRLGEPNQAIYTVAEGSDYSSAFHDVTVGNNDTYDATEGLDPATGWGSPRGDALADDLLGGNTPPPTNDFSIALDPGSASVDPGESTDSTVSTKVTNGDAQTVELSASGLPDGATAGFDPSSVTAGDSSTLSIDTTDSTPAGSYRVSVTGTAGETTHSAVFTLTVKGTPGADDIVNGGFESGGLSGWQSSGAATAVTSPVHGGQHAAKVGGSRSGTVSQTFTATGGTLSLWYQQRCSNQQAFGFLTITLTDNTTGARSQLVQRFCGVNPSMTSYQRATGSLTAGHRYTLTVNNQGIGSFGTTSTFVDDVSDAS